MKIFKNASFQASFLMKLIEVVHHQMKNKPNKPKGWEERGEQGGEGGRGETERDGEGERTNTWETQDVRAQ